MSSKRVENIDGICFKLNETLSQLFQPAGYEITKDEYHKEIFGSRIYIWTNRNEKRCFRLVWDGKDKWFILAESPYSINPEKQVWTDI